MTDSPGGPEPRPTPGPDDPAPASPPPAASPAPPTPAIVGLATRLGPWFFAGGVFVFEIGSWMGDRLRFPGDTAVQIVLILGFLSYGVRLRERNAIDGARLALILAGLLAGFSLDRWIAAIAPWLHPDPPWTLAEYAARSGGEIVSALAFTLPAIALLTWTKLRPRDYRLRFGNPFLLLDGTLSVVTGLALAAVTLGILAWRLPEIGVIPGVLSAAGPEGLALAAVYALANAAGAEIVYRAILLRTLEPVMGASWANLVQALSYGLGFGLYGIFLFGPGAILLAGGAVAVSLVFGRVAQVTGGVGLVILVHALATFLFEVSGLAF